MPDWKMLTESERQRVIDLLKKEAKRQEDLVSYLASMEHIQPMPIERHRASSLSTACLAAIEELEQG